MSLCKCTKDACSGISININPHSRDDCELCETPIKLGAPYLYLHRYRGTQGAQSLKCHESCILDKGEVSSGKNKQSCILCGKHTEGEEFIQLTLTRNGACRMTMHTACLKKALSLSPQEKKKHCLNSKNPATKKMALITFGASGSKEEKEKAAYQKRLQGTILLENNPKETIKNLVFKLVRANWKLAFKTKVGQTSIEVDVTGLNGIYVKYPNKKVELLIQKRFKSETIILETYSKATYGADLENSAGLLLTETNKVIREIAADYFAKKAC